MDSDDNDIEASHDRRRNRERREREREKEREERERNRNRPRTRRPRHRRPPTPTLLPPVSTRLPKPTSVPNIPKPIYPKPPKSRKPPKTSTTSTSSDHTSPTASSPSPLPTDSSSYSSVAPTAPSSPIISPTASSTISVVSPTSPASTFPTVSSSSTTGTDGLPPTTGGVQPTNPTTNKISADTSSPLAAILGGIVGFIALVGLFALIFYRHREKKRERKAAMGGDDGEEGVYGEGEDPSMREAPRTAFRHESFMALVKDAAQGFYAPTASSDPSPVLGSTSTTPAHAGTTAAHTSAGGPLARQGSALSRGTRNSFGSLDYLDVPTTASPASPPHAHAVGLS